MKRIWLFWLLFLPLLAGCAHPISKGFRDQVDPDLSLNQILRSPNNYVGKKVVLGGTIVETRNLENVTEIEVEELKLWDALDYRYPPYYGPYIPGWGIYSYYPYYPYPNAFRRYYYPNYPYYW